MHVHRGLLPVGTNHLSQVINFAERGAMPLKIRDYHLAGEVHCFSGQANLTGLGSGLALRCVVAVSCRVAVC